MLIPIKDDQPTYRTPHLTLALIFLNTAVFLYSQTLGYQGFNNFLSSFGYTPAYYLDLGANFAVPGWYYLTPLTSLFLHGGWVHLIGNMLYLWIVGNNVEDYLGPVKFLIFYAFSGLAAVTLFTVFDTGSTVPLVGASGAIAGVMGAYMVLYPRAQITFLIVFIFIMFRQFPAKVMLGIWFALQVFGWVTGSTTGSGIAYLAHIGGFVFGWLVFKIYSRIRGNGHRQRIHRVRW